MKINLKKLQLLPGDIAVVTVPRPPGGPTCQRRLVKIHDELRKLLPQGQRFVVMYDGMAMEKLADLVTPEELHRMNERMEQRFLAQRDAGPQQTTDSETDKITTDEHGSENEI